MGKGKRVREARKVKVDGKLVDERPVVRPDDLDEEKRAEWLHCCEAVASDLADAMTKARGDGKGVDLTAAKLLFSQFGAIRDAKDRSAILDADFALRFGSTYRKVRALAGHELRHAKKGVR